MSARRARLVRPLQASTPPGAWLRRAVVGPARDARELVAVLSVALAGEVALRASTLPATARLLGIALDLTGAEDATGADFGAPPVLPLSARRQVQVVDAVMRRWPFGDTCLRRCLVLGNRLRRLHPRLVVGVRRGTEGALAAHAWLLIGGRSLDPSAREFAPLGGRS